MNPLPCLVAQDWVSKSGTDACVVSGGYVLPQTLEDQVAQAPLRVTWQDLSSLCVSNKSPLEIDLMSMCVR